MDRLSSSLTQSEAFCAEPEIVEVVLRNKNSRAKAVRVRGVELQCDRGRGRWARTGTTRSNKVACERLLCERCNCPSRLWLRHTCRVAKPAVNTDENVCATAAKSKTRTTPQAAGKILIQRHMIPSASTALSSLSAVTSRCSSVERADTKQKESAAWLLQHRPRSASVRADAESVACWRAKSPGLRRRISSSVQNCDMNSHPARDKVSSQFAHLEKPSQRSGNPSVASPEAQRCGGRGIQKRGANELRSSCACGADDKQDSTVGSGGCISRSKQVQRCGPAVQLNSVQRPLSRTETKNIGLVAPSFLKASPFARRQCSAAGRGFGEDKEKATRGWVEEVEGGGRFQLGWHILSHRRCSCRATEGVQAICRELTLAAVDKTCHRQLDGRKEDLGENAKEHHAQRGAEVSKRASTRVLTGHNLVCRRHTTGSLACTTGRERNNGKGGATTWSKPARWKQTEMHWNVREAENNVSAITAPAENFSALKVSATSRVDQQEMPLWKRRLHGVPPCRCEQLIEDRQTQCSEESFITRNSGVATVSDTGIQEDIHGMEAFSKNNAAPSSAPRKGSCPDSYLSFCHFEMQVKAAVQSASAEEISDGAKKCEVATSGRRNETVEVNGGRPCTNSEWPEREYVGVMESAADAFMAEQRIKWGGKAVRSCSVSEQWTNSCSGAVLEHRSEKPGPVEKIHIECYGTKTRDCVASNFKGMKMQFDCICERVGHFLDTVECFLQESDPQLRREKLYGLHAVFVSVRAG